MRAAASSPALPVLAALFTVTIWANFLISTGDAVGAGLGPAELGLLRILGSVIGLAPVLLRIGVLPKGLEIWRLLVMTIGAGVSFLYIMATGFRFAPPATSGVFAPGCLPLWVALLSIFFSVNGSAACAHSGFF